LEVDQLKTNWQNHSLVLILTIVALIVSVVLFLHFRNTGMEETELEWSFANDETEELETQNEVTDPQSVTIDVKGAVHSPGVYQLDAGSRVHQAIDVAGGLTVHAYGDGINLAQILFDEMVVYIPEIGEAEDGGTIEVVGPAVGGVGGDGKISLNKATQSEFETLPGIGPAKAEAIIQYREEKGRFESVEELMNVSGIGPKSFEKLQDQVTVQ
jgi:competence protein ComEA